MERGNDTAGGSRRPARAGVWIAGALLLVTATALRTGNRNAAALLPAAVQRPAVVLAFRAADCPELTVGLAAWNRSARGDSLAVYGLLIGERRTSRAERIRADHGLLFPVAPDPARRAERFLRTLGYRRTPIVAGLDPDGRLRFTAPWRPDMPRAAVEAMHAAMAPLIELSAPGDPLAGPLPPPASGGDPPPGGAP
jgi:hypothetical protein